jgi:hypothetical protein
LDNILIQIIDSEILNMTFYILLLYFLFINII